MQITSRNWEKYITILQKLVGTAVQLMSERVRDVDLYSLDHDDYMSMIDYAYGLVTKYGEGAGAAACEMYDAVAEASGKSLPPAEIAETASYAETTRAISGTMTNQNNTVPQTVGRLVKQAGADTTLKNALRDGAKFAWIPHGDACAFCITLASRGWQYMSKNALKNGHAEHIHANCDCEYAISFDADPYVEGYDPDYYKRIYYGAKGSTPTQKINAIRREQYAIAKSEGIADTQQADVVQIPEYTPAKTRADAEEFAKQFADSVTYAGISVANVNAINEQLNVLMAKYPIKRLAEINNKSRGIMSANYKSLGINGRKLGKVLRENKDRFTENQTYYRELIADLQTRYEGKTMPPGARVSIEKWQDKLRFKRWGVYDSYGDDLGVVVTHEYAHILSDQYFGMINKERANPNYSTNWSLRGVKQKWQDAFIKARKSGDIYNISEYANSNVDEFFAECFTAREMGEKLPKYISDLIDEVLRNGIM